MFNRPDLKPLNGFIPRDDVPPATPMLRPISPMPSTGAQPFMGPASPERAQGVGNYSQPAMPGAGISNPLDSLANKRKILL